MKKRLITSTWICHPPPAIQPDFKLDELQNHSVLLFGNELAAWESRFHDSTGLVVSTIGHRELVDLNQQHSANLRCCFLVVCIHVQNNLDKVQRAVAALREKHIPLVLLINTPTPIETALEAPEYKYAKIADFSVLFHSPISLIDDLKQVLGQSQREEQSAHYSPCTAIEELLINLFSDNEALA